MATQPTPQPPKPNPPAPAPHPPNGPHDEAARAARPDPADTIIDEQRSRSAEMERKGVEAWKAEHDDRDEKDRPKAAPLRQPGEPDPNFPPAEHASSR